MAGAVTKKALIVVRTYPTPAKTGVEVSCTAAISDAGEWLRLFPVPWRLLDQDQRFRRYQWITVSLQKASDPRPESHKLVPDSIRIQGEALSSDHGWRARKDVVLPLRRHCLCCIKATRDTDGHPTLGIFRPHKIDELKIEPEGSPNWNDDQLAILRQGHLFDKGPAQELEKIPYRFSYRFWCDHSECKSHTLKCVDWEMAEAWRSWRDKYGSGWEAKFRHRFEEEMIHKYDTHFYVGTIHRYPNAWIIVGLFYPPLEAQQKLFEPQ